MQAGTPREREVLDLLAERLRNQDIAARFSIAEKTVKHHIGARRTGVTSSPPFGTPAGPGHKPGICLTLMQPLRKRRAVPTHNAKGTEAGRTRVISM